MRVLKSGSENTQVWTTEETCTGAGWNQDANRNPCGSLLEIKAQDIMKRKHTDISGCTDIYYGFNCPVCGCFTELNDRKIPSVVKSGAKDYYKHRFD